ncbi:hypothetical protein A2690_00680 [Candidatus Roizmanbacteria bacterium RIFCSPHIGHO2_01_FULL_39_12b]|uniref:Penicillin-binding protein 2 n=1 Tax=Candidatus Roizmanbacteria bacterium RIFCSPHIGHO2_01_FULL_39_12b TaxID=1802030 RepID=A0A1F7GAP5_9BACT|nr:MAG: hypothetical protein A2690_00680 [Candidatus Roizmanbacteria bacterium RIFCSPHIGHO2_01_FULL_39_12b]
MNRKLPPFTKEFSSINFKNESIGDWLVRVVVIPLFMLVGFGVLILRLFHLTVVKGTYFSNLAQSNRIKEVQIDAPRGKLYDRKGLLLASSQEIIKDGKISGYKRIYLGNETTAHIIGFRQIAARVDIERDACSSLLEPNDWVGKAGIEKLFDCRLRGKRGKELIEVNAKGKHRKTLATVSPRQGEQINLSLDSELQQKAYDTIINNAIRTNVSLDLTKHHIAIIATIPKTGEVLLSLSYPSFNPNAFEEQNKKLVKSYLNDPMQPLFNRVFQGEYPPGSVFKPVIAVGALEDGKIDKDFEVEDTGVVQAGPQTFGNWYFLQYGRKEGLVDIVKGIRRSNDIFFYKTGEKLGVDGIKKWATTFGFGRPTKSGFPEGEGLIPTNFWKRETLSERWYLGDTYNLSIGQGYLLVTPIQINQAMAAIAENGTYCQPIFEKITDKNKDRLVKCKSLHLKNETLDLVHLGMLEACKTGGTGWPFFTFGQTGSATDSARLAKPVSVGCKTGTAQNHKSSGLPHAWFTAFAPYENPEIVITVLVDGAGEGSSVAAPIAKEILEFYFSRTQ